MEECRSVLGALITYLGGPIDWACEREKKISRSVCEAEVKGMDLCTKMCVGDRHFLRDIGSPVADAAGPTTPMLHADNSGGIC